MQKPTKDHALKILKQLTSQYANETFFKRAEVVAADGGYGVDIWVDGEKWRSHEQRSSIPPLIERVPIYWLMVG